MMKTLSNFVVLAALSHATAYAEGVKAEGGLPEIEATAATGTVLVACSNEQSRLTVTRMEGREGYLVTVQSAGRDFQFPGQGRISRSGGAVEGEGSRFVYEENERGQLVGVVQQGTSRLQLNCQWLGTDDGANDPDAGRKPLIECQGGDQYQISVFPAERQAFLVLVRSRDERAFRFIGQGRVEPEAGQIRGEKFQLNYQTVNGRLMGSLTGEEIRTRIACRWVAAMD